MLDVVLSALKIENHCIANSSPRRKVKTFGYLRSKWNHGLFNASFKSWTFKLNCVVFVSLLLQDCVIAVLAWHSY